MSQYPGSQYSANSAGWAANGYDPALAGGRPPQYSPAAPFQTPQAGYPGAESRPTTSRSLAAPTALAAAGLALLLIAIFGGIGSAVTRGQFNATVTSLPDDQAATVELNKGRTYGLFYSTGDDAPECSVTSPGGDEVTTKSGSSSTKVKGGQLFTTFSSQESGAYTVDCHSTAGVSVGEIVAPSSAKATLLSLFGVVGAIIMAVVGLAMGAGGMAWRSKLAAAGTAPAGTSEAFSTMTGAVPGAPTVYTQGAWQSDQQPQAAPYAQQPQYQQPEPAPYAPSAAGAGAAPQYSQIAPTAQFGWAGQQPAQQQAQPEQPSVFTQPVQQGQYNQQGQPGQPGPYQQPGGWPAQ